MMRIPVSGTRADAPFREVLFLSPDRRYVGTDLMDLSLDANTAERARRRDIIEDLNGGAVPRHEGRDGAVQIVVFSDFQCPYCRAFNDRLLKEIIPKYGDSVTIRYRTLPVASHPAARKVAAIAMCVREVSDELFWTFHDAVFEQQKTIFAANDPAAEATALLNAIVPAAVMPKIRECRQAGHGEKAAARDEAVAVSNAISIAPTVFVNDIRIEGLPAPGYLEDTITLAAREQQSDNGVKRGMTAGGLKSTPATAATDAAMHSLVLSKSLSYALLWARALAPLCGEVEIQPEQLILGALRVAAEEPDSIARALNLSPEAAEKLRAGIESAFPCRNKPYELTSGELRLSNEAQQLMQGASRIAEQRRSSTITPLYLFMAALDTRGRLADVLRDAGLENAIRRGSDKTDHSGH
jgi:protein-disulfide isomerase